MLFSTNDRASLFRLSDAIFFFFFVYVWELLEFFSSNRKQNPIKQSSNYAFQSPAISISTDFLIEM